MMKKMLACLLVLACLLTAFAAFATAEGTMKVIKCKQAVNLRQGPSTDTPSLGLVPLGTVLEGCAPVEGSEWIAVNYQGTAGYIRGDFLAPVDGEAAPAQAEQPVAEAQAAPAVAASQDALKYYYKVPEEAPIAHVTDECTYGDDATIVDVEVSGVRVVARQIFLNKCEYLIVGALNAEGTELWKYETATGDISELTQTDAFIGGTEAMPLVMVYNDWLGLTAIDPVSGAIRWTLAKDKVFLGGSVSRAVGGNGILYIGGYYGPDPVAIDAGGKVLWQASSGDLKATWMYTLELQSDGVLCRYSNMAGDKSGAVLYDYNGAFKEVIYD